ncbi:MAG: type II toxin-antitoxin system HicA family toxin [Burkholderiales bacterium]
MKGYEAELKKILSEHGWSRIRSGKGSHEIWGKQGHKAVTVPYGCKSRHLANRILKNCGIGHKF